MKPLKKILEEVFMVEYPDNIETTKAKFYYWFSWQWHLKEQGAGIFRKYGGIWQEVALGLLVLDRFTNWNIGPLQIGIGIAAILLLCWFGGALFLFYDLDKIEQSIGLMRNPFQKDLHKLIKNKEKL